MIILVGLGNPEEQYRRNRHNVGFMFVDYVIHELVKGHAVVLEDLILKQTFNAQVGRYELNGEKYIVVKPQTFMNASGEAVQKIASFYKEPASSLYVVHDDLDIPFGKFKIQLGTGPKLHNGIDSIEQRLGDSNFYRVRIGVENRAGKQISGESYVLENFLPEEAEKLPEIFSAILKHPLFPHH